MCQQIFSFVSMRYLFVYLVVYIRKVCVCVVRIKPARPTYTTVFTLRKSVMRMEERTLSPCISNCGCHRMALQETFPRPWSCHDVMAVSASRF
ncbi:hypothetical protein CABS03_12023 [Colletotrichum abscissum]|uniref:Uncharacterized protein n=1 Tax=Colletotrichum abscissum TaxID=1671311 RepID=A0A9P9XNY6_9PEZI|nr:hypothetical protein CABS02_02542 [Colletotrichum abscissum]